MLIRIDLELIGEDLPLPFGFKLGRLPHGGYGVHWAAGAEEETPSGGVHFVTWEAPHDPFRIEWNGSEYTFCVESATAEAIAGASLRTIEQRAV